MTAKSGLWTILILLGVLLGSVQGDALSQLRVVQASIQSHGTLSAGTVGSGYVDLEVVLYEPSIGLVDVTTELQTSPPQLTVSAQATVYGQQVSVQVVIYYDASNATRFVLTLDSSGSFADVYGAATRRPVPAALGQLSAQEKVHFVLVTDPQGHAGQKPGLSLSGSAQVTGSGDLVEALAQLQAQVTGVTVTVSVYVDVYSAPDAWSVSVTDSNQFAAGDSDLQVQKVALALQSAGPVSFAVNVALTGTGSSLTGSLNGQWSPSTPLQLTGQLSGSWATPFGLSWLTSLQVTTAQVKFASGTVQLVQLKGQATTTLASASQVGCQLTLQGAQLAQFMVQLMVDDSADLAAWANALDVSVPSAEVQGIQLTSGTLTVANFAGSGFQAGLTLAAQAQLASNAALQSAVALLGPTAATSAFSFSASLFAPVFSASPQDVVISLTESGSFSVANALQCTGFTLTVQVTSSSSVDVQLQASFAASSSLAFQLKSSVDLSSSSSAQFSGSLTSNWVHPAGLEWLQLQKGTQLSGTLSQAAGLTGVSVSGSAVVTFGGNSAVSVSGALSGNDLSQIALSVQGIPFSAGGTAASLFQTLAGQQSGATLSEVAVVSGTLGVCLANYAGAPSSVCGSEGVTVTGTATLTTSSSSTVLMDAVRYLHALPSQLSFALSLTVPVFTTPADFSLTLSETGSLPLSAAVQCTGFSLHVQGGAQEAVSLTTDFAVDVPHASQPVVIQAEGSYSASSSSLSLSGDVTGWTHPFGFAWLTTASLQGSVALAQPAQLQHVSFSGTGQVQFGGTSSGSVQLLAQLTDNLRDVEVVLKVQNVWTTAEILDEVLSGQAQPNALLQDLALAMNADLTLSVATASGGSYPQGVTLDTQGSFTNSLLAAMKQRLYWDARDLAGLSFSLALTVPVFSADPLDVDVAFQLADHIALNSHVALTDVDLDVAFAPLTVKVAAQAQGNFSGNPGLSFEVAGTYAADMTVTVQGSMEGTWHNAFGLRGFDLDDAALELGFNPAMCAATACISDVGVAAKMSFGAQETVSFAGNVAAPDFADVFLAGSVDGADGMALTVLDVVEEWNALNYPARQIPTDDFPSDWGLSDSSFFLAPKAECIGQLCYPQGFGISTGITILEMQCDLSINCSSADGCDFAFHADLNLTDFTNMIKRELSLMDPPPLGLPAYDDSLVIFRVDNLSLSEWSQQNVANLLMPRWLIGITVFDHSHLLDFHVHHQYDLDSKFHDFFIQWLKNLFE